MILIEWVDSASVHGWQENHESADIEVACTAGFLVYEDKHIVKIAQSAIRDWRMSEIITIPKVNIKQRKKVR